MTRTRLGIGSILVAIVLVQTGCFPVDAIQRQEEISKSFDLKRGGSVSVRNVNGSITVTGWDQERVQLVAVKSAGGFDDHDAQENLKRLEVHIDQNGNTLTVETRSPSGFHFGGGVTYTLKVPRRCDLELHSTNGGLNTSDVEGTIRLGTTNGTIKADNIGGTLNGTTTNGRIIATFNKVSGDLVHLSTTNGSIQLSLPEDAGAVVEAHTTNGSIKTDFPITTRGTVGRHSLEGTIGKGGTRIQLRTTNGSISILQGSRGTV
ncbi:MAG: DUF4097 family beta strand repeat-containing protein [Acidobacteriia bacterium]|nr:DUF4097 family beta strand repeat-containing protein [Terriglobia bacterium]